MSARIPGTEGDCYSFLAQNGICGPDGFVRLLDQTLLPTRLEYRTEKGMIQPVMEEVIRATLRP